jgi:hypothetical protein
VEAQRRHAIDAFFPPASTSGSFWAVLYFSVWCGPFCKNFGLISSALSAKKEKVLIVKKVELAEETKESN